MPTVNSSSSREDLLLARAKLDKSDHIDPAKETGFVHWELPDGWI